MFSSEFFQSLKKSIFTKHLRTTACVPAGKLQVFQIMKYCVCVTLVKGCDNIMKNELGFSSDALN